MWRVIILIVHIVANICLRNLRRGTIMDKKECENILKEMGFSTARSQSNAAGLLVALGRHGLEKPKKKKKKKVLETIDVMEPKKIYRNEAGGGR